MSLLSANAVPLPDVLPWADALPPQRTVLINDSVGTDGRFLLHTLACQTLRGGGGAGAAGASAPSPSSGGRVLWLGCTPASVKQIASALKKIGCDASLTMAATIGSSGRGNGNISSAKSRRLEIVPIMLEAATTILSSNEEEEKNEARTSLTSGYLQKLYRRIKSWLDESSSPQQPNLIVVDDATGLATIFGPRNVEFFLRQVRSLSLRQGCASMAVLCSTDADQDRYLTAAAREGGGVAVNVAGGGSAKSTWIGAGSDGMAVEQEH